MVLGLDRLKRTVVESDYYNQARQIPAQAREFFSAKAQTVKQKLCDFGGYCVDNGGGLFAVAAGGTGGVLYNRYKDDVSYQNCIVVFLLLVTGSLAIHPKETKYLTRFYILLAGSLFGVAMYFAYYSMTSYNEQATNYGIYQNITTNSGVSIPLLDTLPQSLHDAVNETLTKYTKQMYGNYTLAANNMGYVDVNRDLLFDSSIFTLAFYTTSFPQIVGMVQHSYTGHMLKQYESNYVKEYGETFTQIHRDMVNRLNTPDVNTPDVNQHVKNHIQSYVNQSLPSIKGLVEEILNKINVSGITSNYSDCFDLGVGCFVIMQRNQQCEAFTCIMSNILKNLNSGLSFVTNEINSTLTKRSNQSAQGANIAALNCVVIGMTSIMVSAAFSAYFKQTPGAVRSFSERIGVGALSVAAAITYFYDVSKYLTLSQIMSVFYYAVAKGKEFYNAPLIASMLIMINVVVRTDLLSRNLVYAIEDNTSGTDSQYLATQLLALCYFVASAYVVIKNHLTGIEKVGNTFGSVLFDPLPYLPFLACLVEYIRRDPGGFVLENVLKNISLFIAQGTYPFWVMGIALPILELITGQLFANMRTYFDGVPQVMSHADDTASSALALPQVVQNEDSRVREPEPESPHRNPEEEMTAVTVA